MTSPRANGLIGQHDRTEVATADDLAARRADEFLALALLNQRGHARREAPSQAGVCTWCGEPCQVRAVYCDADCRADHESELAARARQGRAA